MKTIVSALIALSVLAGVAAPANAGFRMTLVALLRACVSNRSRPRKVIAAQSAKFQITGTTRWRVAASAFQAASERGELS